MKFDQRIILKNGKEAWLRNADTEDGAALCDIFAATHMETDYLLSYSDENSLDNEHEGQFLHEKAVSPNEIEIIAIVDGKVVGTAGIEAVGKKYKVRHRADFGISILKEYWGLGLGRALASACIQCAKDAGFVQLELTAVAENERALSLYKALGFVEFGRNPRGFKSRVSGYQELVYMLLSL